MEPYNYMFIHVSQDIANLKNSQPALNNPKDYEKNHTTPSKDSVTAKVIESVKNIFR